uniref:Anaphase-promoting complex subunit 4 WD40 domain-containing protein n=1 Tax=Chlamydomonas euryale TaxID=1486919 RepID=A0A7R9UZV1_9CHLO
MVISASDDGTARLWAGKGLATEVAVLRPPPAPGTPAGARTPLLSAEFSPEEEHLVAVASADRCAYLFDMRRTDVPLQVMRGHDAPVTYLAFLAGQRLVSAGADAAVAVWDVAGTASHSGGSASRVHEPLIVMRGHRNEKNFVGLSVRPHDGLIACGSETGAVFVYYPEWSLPIATASVVGNMQNGDVHAEFVSAVCWLDTAGGGGPPMLAAGTSCGTVSLLALAEA